jgi:uncharacterized membrane protein
MSKKETKKEENVTAKKVDFVFSKDNYKWLFIGIATIVLGFILMIGGGSDDPSKFNADELFSPIRITLAPFLIIIGYVVIFYAIMKRNKKDNQDA